MTDYRGRTYKPRTFTPEQLAAKRARERRWNEANAEKRRVQQRASYNRNKAAGREQIEQAIARGVTAGQIADRLNVPIERVHKVWDALDALAVSA